MTSASDTERRTEERSEDVSVAELRPNGTRSAMSEAAIKETALRMAFIHATTRLPWPITSRRVNRGLGGSMTRSATNLRRLRMCWEARRGWAERNKRWCATTTVANTKLLGDKLASDATWTREEVAQGFESLDNTIVAWVSILAAARRLRRSMGGREALTSIQYLGREGNQT